MTSRCRKLQTTIVSVTLVLSVIGGVIAISSPSAAYSKTTNSVSLDNSPSVNVSDATIDPSNESRIPVAVNLSNSGLQPSEIRLKAVNENPRSDYQVNATILSDADFSSNESKGNITLKTSPIKSGAPSFTLNVTAYNTNTGNPIPDATNESTITIDDTTDPEISDVNLSNDGYDKFKLTFNSSEHLGNFPSNLTVTVSGPNGATYSFDRLDFFRSASGENYTYRLNQLQSFDDGGGTYTVSIDTAEDHYGNDGQASAPSDTYSYTTDFSSKSITNQPGGPALDTSNVTMYTKKIRNQFVFVRLENDTSSFDRRDLSGEGATEQTKLWVNFTVDSFNPDVMMGTANVDSWNYTMNGDGSANVNVSLQPASTERNYSAWQAGVQRPGNWNSDYDGSDLSMNAVVDFGIGNLSSGGGGPKGLDGARLTTDAQAFTVPKLDANNNLSVDVASPHCVASTSAPSNQCSGDEVNDDGFYEAVIPAAFYQNEWGVSQLSAGDVDVEYTSGGSGSSEDSWNISVRQDGALVLNGTNLHYSEGTVNIVQTEDSSSDDGDTGDSEDSGGGGSGVNTEITSEHTSDGTRVDIEGVTLDDPTVSFSAEGVSTDAITVTKASATFDQGSNSDTSILVSARATKPADLPEPPGSDALGYVSIDVEGALQHSISAGAFTVELTSAEVDSGSTLVYRYHDGEWREVEADRIDGTRIEVTTEGFSVFAITGADEKNEVTSTNRPIVPSKTHSTGTPTATQSPSKKGPETEPSSLQRPTPTARTDTPRVTTASAPSTNTGGQPGFGILSLLISVTAIVFWMNRRTV